MAKIGNVTVRVDAVITDEQYHEAMGAVKAANERMDLLETENAELQDENARLRSCLSDDAENARMIMAENEKLRELCATVIDDWMSKVCPTFPFCEYGGEYQDCTDETCGNQIYRQMARELGVEVDDA